MMTSLGFPFSVDHDTNYVTFAGNYGGVPENWHVEYCKGEAEPKNPEDLEYETGWHAEFFFFPGQNSSSNGYDIAGKKANYVTLDNDINYPDNRSW
jgi:hypothetical protein